MKFDFYLICERYSVLAEEAGAECISVSFDTIDQRFISNQLTFQCRSGPKFEAG